MKAIIFAVLLGLVILGCSADVHTKDLGSSLTGSVVATEKPEQEIPEPNVEPEEEPQEETKEEPGEIIEEEPEIELKKGKTHVINLIDPGFEKPKLTIKKGDTVVWQNVRDGSFDKGFIIGTRNCRHVRSEMYGPGEVFSHTFEEKGLCIIADGIYTKESMKIYVE